MLMYPRFSALIQKGVLQHILSLATGIMFLILMLQIFITISLIVKSKMYTSRTLNNEIFLIKIYFSLKKNKKL